MNTDMESCCASSLDETPQCNGGGGGGGSGEGSTTPPNAYSYNDVFPALPDNSTHSVLPNQQQRNNKMVAPSTTITQIITIPDEERRYKENALVVPGGVGGAGEAPATTDTASHEERRRCARIMKETSTTIEFDFRRGAGVNVIVSGKRKAVEDARKQILAELQMEARIVLSVPKEQHRFILGAKAERLHQIEKDTGTKITVPRQNDNSNEIVVTGPKEGLDLAKQKIIALSDQAYERLEIPHEFHPFIQGPRNQTIDRIRAESKATIRIPSANYGSERVNGGGTGGTNDEAETTNSKFNPNIITISGTRGQVALAKQRIMEEYEKRKCNCQTAFVEVPKKNHKYILGKNGQTLQELFDKTGVWVELPPTSSADQTVRLRGDPDKLGQALSLVWDKANSIKTEEISAPVWMHKFLIGKHGENIKRILQDRDSSTHVSFLDEKDRICVEGPREHVNDVVKALSETVSELMKTMDHRELRVPVSFHPHIIGKSGASVNKLKKDLNVKIHIPSAGDRHPDVLTIEGDRDGVDKACLQLMEQVKKLESEVSRELACENRLHGTLIGAKGEKIQEIRRMFNQVNIMFPDANSKLDIITIRGNKQDVDKCYKHMEALVRDLMEKNHKIEVLLFRQFLKYIQSKGKMIVRQIQSETDTRIKLPAPDAGTDMVSIVGPKEQVAKAKQMLLAAQVDNADLVEVEILVPSAIHGMLLRDKGRLLESILDECGCGSTNKQQIVNVSFPQKGSGSDKVSIYGPKEEVNLVKQRLVELANERALVSHTEEVKAKPQHHRFLIGRNGATIRKLREKTSARIVFPTEESEDKETIHIIGRKEAVKAARVELETMIKNLENIVEDSVMIPSKHHKYFVARRAHVLTQIGEEFGGVQVSFPHSNHQSDKVTIKGAKDCVEGAKQRLLEISRELDSQVTIQCNIPQEHHRTVMGPKGSKVQAITAECNVQIKFPDRTPAGQSNGDVSDESRDVILITGQPADCEKAKQRLIEMTPIVDEMDIPSRFRPHLIGAKGKGVRDLMERFDVSINIPQQQQQQRDDVGGEEETTTTTQAVRITGSPANVQLVREEIAARIEQLERDEEDRRLRNFEVTVNVPMRFMSKLVGRKGATVNELRQRHSVMINLPTRDAPDAEQVIIVGYEERAIACRDDILKLVADLECRVTEAISLDSRVHARLIGSRGRAIRQLMQEYDVDIRFPRQDDEDPDRVEITGHPAQVSDVIDYLKQREDDMLEGILEREQYERPSQPTATVIWGGDNNNTSSTGGGKDNEDDDQDHRPHGRSNGRGGRGGRQPNRGGFVVRGGPWEQQAPDTQSQAEFPEFGATSMQQPATAVAWGPRR